MNSQACFTAFPCHRGRNHVISFKYKNTKKCPVHHIFRDYAFINSETIFTQDEKSFKI